MYWATNTARIRLATHSGRRLHPVSFGKARADHKYREVVAFQKDYVRGEYDKILQDKTEIKLEEIFDPVFCQGGYEVPLKILIDGAPGVG